MKDFVKGAAVACLLMQATVALAGDPNYQTIPDEAWRTAGNVVDFQPFAAASVTFDLRKGDKTYRGKLTNLNQRVNVWYLVELQAAGGKGQAQYFNLENSLPESQTLGMTPEGTLLLHDGKGNSVPCPLFGEADGALDLLGIKKPNPYVSLCGGKVFWRTQQQGNRLNYTWSKEPGESTPMPWDYPDDVLAMSGEYLFGNALGDLPAGAQAGPRPPTEGTPKNAAVSRDATIPLHNTGVAVAEITDKALHAGQWYKAANHDGVFVSLMQPRLVDQAILKSFPGRVAPIDRAGGKSNGRGEGQAVVVSVALDLSKYSIGWNNGTTQPDVGWSKRATGAKKLPEQGPDGFRSIKPWLAFPGVVHPLALPKVIGTFAGGFQRKDSAFKMGPLRGFNKGHHYGFMEKGVVMSALVPNLATLITYTNGDIDLKTWRKEDDESLHRIRDARQNGVPLIENGEPSPLVSQWVPGNWLGSAKIELKTPRSSVCLMQNGGNRYLMISYFASHTPNAVARVLQSYGCDYAMHLDMNGLKLAYAALFQRDPKGGFNIEHLYAPMKGEDVKANGLRAPHSVVTPNYKDFFFILKR